jgi:hypothetical protein
VKVSRMMIDVVGCHFNPFLSSSILLQKILASLDVVPLFLHHVDQEQQPPLRGVGYTCFCFKICFFTPADPFSNKLGTSSICN